jgi:hypothetical protein
LGEVFNLIGSCPAISMLYKANYRFLDNRKDIVVLTNCDSGIDDAMALFVAAHCRGLM